jgi:hypothetical protein
MGLISHGIAVGIGYYIAQPGGQRQLAQLRQRAVGLVHSPQVAQLQERGRGLVGGPSLAAGTAVGNGRAEDNPAHAGPALNESAAAGSPVVDASAPIRGRRLRRQRSRQSGRLRSDRTSPGGSDAQAQPVAGSAAVASSPTPGPLGDRAHRPSSSVEEM